MSQTTEESFTSQDTFLKYIAMQIRAMDGFGTWEKFTDDQLIESAFLSTEELGGPKIELQDIENVQLQLRAASQILEKQTGMMCQILCEAGCDGSVRSVVFNGKAVILQKVFWNTGTFRKKSFEKFSKVGNRLLENLTKSAEEMKEKYPELLAD